MAVLTTLLTFNLKSTTSTNHSDAIATALKALASTSTSTQAPSSHYTLAVDTQDSHSVYLTVECPDANSPTLQALTSTLRPILGAPTGTHSFNLNTSIFGPTGASTSQIVEYALSDFAISVATDAFRARVESEFLEFDELFCRGAKGNGGVAFGWSADEHNHDDVQGKTRRFVVIRGWESLEDFRESYETVSAKEAFPILHSWGAGAFKMLLVERKMLV